MTTDAELLDLRGEIQRLRRCIGTLFNQQSLFTPSRESTLSPIVVMLRKIAAAAESLEEQLAERTHELTAANEALGREIVEHARAEEALGVAREALARAARVTNIGELTASIAHEVNQPLAAIVTNGEASLRWLAAEPPNLREVHGAVERVVGDANRASEVIARIHAFLSRGKSCVTRFQVEDTVADVIALARDKALQCGVSLREDCAADVPSVEADRVQLQQVILNLVMNGIEAMSAITSHARNLVVGVKRYAPDAILVTVRDSGNGLDPQQRARIFQSFYTTKADGIGMGLAISRSIVNAHGGRLWSTSNDDIGETFQFTLPTAGASTA